MPADGYFEWKKEGKVKQPYFFHRRDGKPFAFTALWEWWNKGGGTNPELRTAHHRTERDGCQTAQPHARDFARRGLRHLARPDNARGSAARVVAAGASIPGYTEVLWRHVARVGLYTTNRSTTRSKPSRLLSAEDQADGRAVLDSVDIFPAAVTTTEFGLPGLSVPGKDPLLPVGVLKITNVKAGIVGGNYRGIAARRVVMVANTKKRLGHNNHSVVGGDSQIKFHAGHVTI